MLRQLDLIKDYVFGANFPQLRHSMVRRSLIKHPGLVTHNKRLLQLCETYKKLLMRKILYKYLFLIINE